MSLKDNVINPLMPNHQFPAAFAQAQPQMWLHSSVQDKTAQKQTRKGLLLSGCVYVIAVKQVQIRVICLKRKQADLKQIASPNKATMDQDKCSYR